MSELPSIKVTSLDLERLETLLGCLCPHSHPQAPRLQAELARAEVVAPEHLPFDVVSMNSRVRFRTSDTEQEFECALCYPADVDDQADGISILAPIGSALLGLSVGQSITWPLAEGRLTEVEIIEVSYQPERVGEFDR